MVRLRRAATLGATALAAILLLSGCVPAIPASELPAYTVLYEEERDSAGSRDFTFIDSAGDRQDIECLKDGFFSKTVCESADGVVSFGYTVYKGNLRVREITVDGSERPMTTISTKIEGARKAWAPSDSIPEEEE